MQIDYISPLYPAVDLAQQGLIMEGVTLYHLAEMKCNKNPIQHTVNDKTWHT